MALEDDLRRYIAHEGFVGLPSTHAALTILGERHGSPSSTPLCHEFLQDPSIRFFANESFLNSTVIRQGTRDYLYHHVLPPPFNPADSSVGRYEQGKRLLIPRFTTVLDDLRARPRYILNIGSTLETRTRRRDARLAQHFFEEFHDRRLSRRDRGLVLLGANHAAAAAVVSEAHTTTRMILEKHGFKCVSVLLMSGELRTVRPIDAETEIDLLALLPRGRSRLALDLRGHGSPFHSVRLEDSDTGNSVATQFEFMILG